MPEIRREDVEELIKLLNSAPKCCSECEHSVLVKDPYATGDSPSVYECNAGGCDYQEAIDALSDNYIDLEYKLGDIDEDSAEFEDICAVLEQADKVFNTTYWWRS